ncbi:MAG: succinyl-diaminopimelate desuccinylase [Acidimicrobiia bacterium]|nr:succinyl-diaminopimelate desuccinylase [Acidimicrobiia bacterium]
MASLLDTLTWLIDVPSPYGSEERLCDELEQYFAGHPVTRVGNGLVVGERTGKPLLLLVGHIDTVPHQGQPPAYVEGDRLHGLGASDMKSGVAVMMHLLEDPDVDAGPYDVIGVFYDREEGPIEENQLRTILTAVPWLTDAEFAVVLEPTNLDLEEGCNGAMNITLRFEGRAAHSARPWLGENAILKATALLDKFAALEPRPVEINGLTFYEVMGPTLASGGIARNIIPKDFEVNVSYRFTPDRTIEQAEEYFRSFVGDLADEIVFVDRAPSGPVPEHDPHLERLEVISEAQRQPKQGWTDVARLAEFGVPGINYGPGETALAHQVEESVPIDHLDTAFGVLKRWLTER